MARSILRVVFALSKLPHLHRGYLLASRLNCTPLYTGEEIWFAAALCEWLVTLIILIYIQTLCPQFVGIEISFFTVTSGHDHKGCFPCCGKKKEEKIEGVSIPV